MSWNYKAVQHYGYVGLHEVYYDHDGKIVFWSIPIEVGDDIEELKESLQLMLADIERYGLLPDEYLKCG